MLFDHWEAKRGGRLAPRWREIEPGDIKPVLPFISVADVFESPFDLRFRLVGTAIVEAAGYDFMGRNLRGMEVLDSDVEGWLKYYRRIVDEKRPLFGRYRVTADSEFLRIADHVALPLSDDGLTVNRIIEIEDWSVIRGVNLKRMENTAFRFEPL
ncbi:MAG: hypothetical protein QOK29_4025 [Rhodospirillaceae bacterium]|jgi:hypothetical protein|nr:hypothetical protein [Rhodospirillaceae bacterium]